MLTVQSRVVRPVHGDDDAVARCDHTARQLVHTPGFKASSRHRFDCIDLLFLEFGGGLFLPHSSRTARLTKVRPAQAVTPQRP